MIEHYFDARDERLASSLRRSECEECGRAATFLLARWTDARAGFHWVCDEHGAEMMPWFPLPVRAISPTCQAPVDGHECGALASHVLIVGRRDDAEFEHIWTVGVCMRHAGVGEER